MLTSAAPTEAGSSTPTLRFGGKSRANLRASRNDPISAWPKVTVWPSESVMANRRQERLAVRHEPAMHQVDLLAAVAEGVAAQLQQLLPHFPGARSTPAAARRT